MNSNNYNSGTELNFNVSNIETSNSNYTSKSVLVCINHEKHYDSIDYSEGIYKGGLRNSGYVMPNEEAEARCRYLHNKYRVVNPKLGMVRASDDDRIKYELDLESLSEEEAMMMRVYIRRGENPNLIIKRAKEQSERIFVRGVLKVNNLL